MAKLRDVRTDEQTAVRTKKLSDAGLNCYLTSGVTSKFLSELEKLSTSYYYKKGIKGDLDWLLDMARDKVLDMLPLYDSSKGPLVPFIFSCIRNRGSSVSRRENRKIPESFISLTAAGSQTDTLGDSIVGYMDSLESPEMEAETLYFHSFETRAVSLGLNIRIDEVKMNVKEGVLTPLSKVYAWLYLKGAL